MSKRFGLVLVALLVVPLLLTACSSESRDAAKDYVDAVLAGDAAKADALACDSYQDQTNALVAAYDQLGVTKKDLKYDIGKGNNQEEIIVTGSYDVGEGENAKQFELAKSVRSTDENDSSESYDTRIVLWMSKDSGSWCVTDKTQFGPMMFLPSGAVESKPVIEESTGSTEEAPMATPEATEVMTPEASE